MGGAAISLSVPSACSRDCVKLWKWSESLLIPRMPPGGSRVSWKTGSGSRRKAARCSSEEQAPPEDVCPVTGHGQGREHLRAISLPCPQPQAAVGWGQALSVACQDRCPRGQCWPGARPLPLSLSLILSPLPLHSWVVVAQESAGGQPRAWPQPQSATLGLSC